MKYGLAVVAFIVVAFLGILLFGNRSSNNSGTTNNSTTTKATNKAVRLSDYDNKNAIVSVTIQGRMVGEEERRAIRISVTPTERRLEILSNYEQNVDSSSSYPNTQEAYINFLRGLHDAGFTKTQKTTITDYRGVCPLGKRYIYDLSEGGEHRLNTWSNSCNNAASFAGNGPIIRQLFQLQIPDYSKQVQDVKL